MNIKKASLLVIVLFSLASCDKKAVSKIKIWAIDDLKSEYLAKNINLDEHCGSSHLGSEKKTQLLCEDMAKAKALKEKILVVEDYQFFIDCAKNYSETMTKMVEQMRELDPEGYKTLHFGDETALYKYLELPETMRVMSTCEHQAEVKYWRGLIKRGLKPDLEFCVDVMNKCQDDAQNPCPKNKDIYLEECSAKLKAII